MTGIDGTRPSRRSNRCSRQPRPACCAGPPTHLLRSDPSAARTRSWPSAASGRTGTRRTRQSLRSWAGRISGRSDRRLLVALAGATEAIVDPLRPPRRPPGRAGGRHGGRGRVLRPGDRAVAGRGAPPAGRRWTLHAETAALSRPAAVVVGCRWLERRSELAFVTRSIAGAASRCGPVAVLVPGDPGRRADGAFDLRRTWAPLGALQWPDGLPTDDDRHRRRPDA